MASQGPRFPATAASLANAGTSENSDAWTTPSNVFSDNGVESTIVAASYDSPDIGQLLVASNFGFTIPADATIDGIIVEIERRSIVANSGKDFRVQLATGTTFASLVGTNKAVPATIWPTAATIATYGGAADTWASGLTAAQINAAGFAVFLSAQANIANADIGVDFIRVTVHYTAITSVSPDPVAAPTAVPVPAVTAGRLVSPSPSGAATAIPSLVVTAGRLVSPTPVAAVLDVPVSVFTAGAGPTIVSPDPVVATLAVPDPIVSAGRLVAPSPVEAATAIPGLSATAGRIVEPAPAPTSLAVPSPAISAGRVVELEPVSAELAIPAPSLSAGALIALEPVAVILETPGATFTAGAAGALEVTPDPVPIVLEVPSISISAGRLLLLDPVALALEVPTPTVTAAGGSIDLSLVVASSSDTHVTLTAGGDLGVVESAAADARASIAVAVASDASADTMDAGDDELAIAEATDG